MSSRLCPWCMQMTDADTCPHCGKSTDYTCLPVHLPAGYVVHGKHPYVLGAALGQGGFGITYIALDMQTNERVAIKEYFPTFCANRTDGAVWSYPNQEDVFLRGRDRFLDEARVLKSLSDLSSIVNVLDFFERNNSAYLVMEFLEGDSLKAYAKKHGRFPAQAFLQKLKPLMEDIERMHQRGVVHRDIAPDNIILTPDGQLKLIDFGAARSYVGDKSMTVVVKKGFAPIEQYMRHGSTAATDVYALAATIYYCITGTVPPDSAERQYDEDMLKSPISLGAELSREQERAILNALEVQPKKRTQSVAELIKALEHAPRPEKQKPVKAVEKPQPIKEEEKPKPVKKAEKSEEEPKKKVKWIIPAIAAALLCTVGTVLFMGKESPEKLSQSTLDTSAEVPETSTIPEDGNPDDETCKGTYTVADDEAKENADIVVATMGEHTLTNAQLQTFYWMQVQNFLSSEYGSAMLYYGMLDKTQPLDMQISAMEDSLSWQQFFLRESLTTWKNYRILADKAKEAGMELSEDQKEYLDTLEENLAASAESYGMETVEDLLRSIVGAGVDVKDYKYFQEMLMYGNLYYDAEMAKLTAEPEELEAFFAEHESSYAESGITKEGDYVNVRHVLFVPEGGTTDETGAKTYSEEEWAACEMRSQEILNAWVNQGDLSEESFAALAAAYSQDPGSQTNGGLYENVYKGQMVPEFEQWCFDDARKPGHYGCVKTDYGYHLMYFVSKTPIWQYYAKQDLLTEKSGAVMDNLVAGHSMDVDYSSICLAVVNLVG